MLKEECQRTILSEVELHNRIRLTDIEKKLKVFIAAARRDIKTLDMENKLRKVPRRTVLLVFAIYSLAANNVYTIEAITKITEKALLKANGVVLIQGGKSFLEMVRLLPETINLTCSTLSLTVAYELLNKPNIEIIFIPTRYVDADYRRAEFNWDIVQTKKAVIAASKKTVLLCISEKLNSRHPYKTCGISYIETMITELEPSHNQVLAF